MKHKGLCILVSWCLVLTVRAEVIDRIVAVVDGQIITLSDLRQERVIRVQLGEKPIDDDRMLAKELIDRRLIEKQIADYPNIEVTSDEVSDDLRKLNLFLVTDPRNRNAVVVADAQGRILDATLDIRDSVSRRIRIQKFFDMKFRAMIRPAEDAIRKYYDEVFVPAARSRGLDQIPPLTDTEMAAAIRDNVIQESLDHEVDVWLEAIRRRSKIEVFE
jgi:hypothetical protein